MIDSAALNAFLPEFAGGFLINLEVASAAVAIGLLGGMPLAALRHTVPVSEIPVRWLIRLAQAGPVYVIMFLLLNALPDLPAALRIEAAGLGFWALVLAQGVNMVAYVEENGLQALRYFRQGETTKAMLFLPNLMRGFVVVVMSSGIGAAVGVREAVGITMRHAQRIPDLAGRVMLFLLVIAFFTALFGTANALVRRLVRRLSAAA